jgi:hypothetical protein
MYNLSVHYENIYNYLRTIIADPRVGYLHPFGSTQPEHLEMLRDDSNPPDQRDPPQRHGPLFFFHDQEPVDFEYNRPLFDHLRDKTHAPCILVTTEQESSDAELVYQEYPFARLNYFFHIFAAADWFRGHQYLPGLILPSERTIEKTYISFNRLTSNRRIYRSLLVNELYKNNLLDSGYVSYSHHCPDDGAFDDNLRKGVPEYKFDPMYIKEAIDNIKQIPELRIDFPGQPIPNQSMNLGPLENLMRSFVYVVTETCYFQHKTHLTEKIFKPIVLRMPFILTGCAYNLDYLRSYGFKTFSDYWDESYDRVEDPVERLKAITEVIKTINQLSVNKQKSMLLDMQPILDHNYNLFTNDLVDQEWARLKQSLKDMCDLYRFQYPYRPNFRLGQSIPADYPIDKNPNLLVWKAEPGYFNPHPLSDEKQIFGFKIDPK